MSGRLAALLPAMAALLAAGLATGTRIYYLLFFVLLILILFSFFSALWTLLTVRASLKGVKPRVERGERVMTILTVRHASPLPAGSLRVQLTTPGGAGATQEISVRTPPFVKRSFRSVLRCPHRGSYEAGIASISAGDLFGLVYLRRRWPKKPVRVEVQPRAAEAEEMPLKALDIGPEFVSRASEDNASPSDVRKWQEGDELKKVHWKLTMRKRELMVRTFEESARPDTLVIPDLSEISALNDLKLTLEDQICEACLGVARAQLRAGYPVRMPLTSKRPQELSAKFIGELPAFADALMRVNFDSPYAYEQVLMLMMRRLQRTGGAALATAKLTTRVADIAMRMQQSGIQVRLIWVSDAPGSEALGMLERLRMAGVQTVRLNPWEPADAAGVPPAADADEAGDF